MKKDRSCGWSLASIGRILSTLIGIFLAYGSFANNTPPEELYARQIMFELAGKSKVPDNVKVRTSEKGTKYVIIAIDSENHIYDAESVPSGINVKRYLLVEGVWMQTTKRTCGDMIFDNDILPFDNTSGSFFSNGNTSNTTTKKPLSACPPLLEARLEVRRVMHKYADPVVDKYKYDNVLWQKLRDSLFSPTDSVFLYLTAQGGEEVSFKIVANDAHLIEDDSFKCNGGKLCLADCIWQTFLPSIDAALKDSKEIPIERVRIIPEGHVPSFIKTVSLVVQPDALVDFAAKPNIQIPPEDGFWEWIKGHIAIVGICIIAVLALVGFLIWWFFFKSNPVKQPKSKDRFVFRLGMFLPYSKYAAVVEKLQSISDKAENDYSIGFNVDVDKREVSFEVNKDNAKWFVSQEGDPTTTICQILNEYINEARKENLDEDKQAGFDKEIQAAKETLENIEEFVALLSYPSSGSNGGDDVGSPTTPEEQQGELEKYKRAFANLENKLGFSRKLKLEEAYKVLEGYVGNWADLKRKLAPDSPKDSSVIVKRIDGLETQIVSLKDKINRLNKEIKEWTNKTGCDTPDEAKKEIDSLSTIVTKLKEDPKLFKGDKNFKELTQLIEDAEEGSKIREELNNNPDKIDKNSPTGILVRKGRIFDEYVEIADEVFKRGDADSITKAILESPIAIQVKKGNFLDKAKNNVKLIREDEEGWIGDTELKQFIEYIVNPDEILKSSRTNTGLYKLMNEINAIIAPESNAHKPIETDNLKYNWLKDRLIKVIEGHNKYLEAERVASLFGTDRFDTSCLEPEVKKVYDAARSYLKFGDYENYWENIAVPLLTTLDELQNHSDTDNFRALMFYVSQFYSIARVMNVIYGKTSFFSTRAELNVSLFNTATAPVLTPWGFPQLDSNSLMSCKHKISLGAGEAEKIKYLGKYKPMPFIFIESYYDDNILS